MKIVIEINKGLKTQGLFRVSGSSKRIKILITKYDKLLEENIKHRAGEIPNQVRSFGRVNSRKSLGTISGGERSLGSSVALGTKILEETEGLTIFDIADALKKYTSQLSEPVFTQDLSEYFLQAVGILRLTRY